MIVLEAARGGWRLNSIKAHLLVFAIVIAGLVLGFDRTLSLGLFDARHEWSKRSATGSVVIVGIDDKSLKAVGVWPWPRNLHADLIGKLSALGASEIVFDIDFSSRSTAEGDADMAKALAAAGGSVVLPSFVQTTHSADGRASVVATHPLEMFRAQSWAAGANVIADTDGFVRRYGYGDTIDGAFMPSMGALLGGAFKPQAGSFIIDFSIDHRTIPVYSFKDVIDGKVSAADLSGLKVIIGATAIELGDRFAMPGGEIIAGVTLQALAAESMLQGRALKDAPKIVSLVMAAALVALLALVWRRGSARVRAGVIVASAITCEAAAIWLQASVGVVLDSSYSIIAAAAALVILAIDEVDVRGLMATFAETRFRRVAMSLGDALVCTGPKGEISFWNPGATEIFGFDRNEVLGENIALLDIRGGQLTLAHVETLFPATAEDTANRFVELRGRRKSGETFPVEVSMCRWRHGQAFHFGFVLRDISARKAEEQRILFLATHDVMTGLSNRMKLGEDLAQLLKSAEAGNQAVPLLLLGIDHFKDINDTHGQAVGDAVIREVASRIKMLVPDAGITARVSGDEFAIAVPGLQSAGVDAVVGALAQMVLSIGERTVTITHTIGSAVFPQDGTTAQDLIANAALALQDGKSKARGQHVAYDASIRRRIEETRALEAELVDAFDKRQFELFYQPQIDFASGKIVGAEALIRWKHPSRGYVSPGAFMPVLDTMVLSGEVGRWVIEQAARQAGLWHRAGYDMRIGINLSPALFERGDLFDIVTGAIDTSGVPAHLIDLEVTENILLDRYAFSSETLRNIRARGIGVAFDDFGTGYASLTYLRRFPLDRIKIDQSFVKTMVTNSEDRAIVGALVGLGRLLDMHIIAEGIEDQATADALAAMGCHEGQGYHFGRPVSAGEFETRFLSAGAEAVPSVLRRAVAV